MARKRSIATSQFGTGIDAVRAHEVSAQLKGAPQLDKLLSNAREQVATDKRMGKHVSESEVGTAHKTELQQLEAVSRVMGAMMRQAGPMGAKHVPERSMGSIENWAERKAGLLLLRKWRAKHPEYGPVLVDIE
jgi:hypothetical protein